MSQTNRRLDNLEARLKRRSDFDLNRWKEASRRFRSGEITQEQYFTLMGYGPDDRRRISARLEGVTELEDFGAK